MRAVHSAAVYIYKTFSTSNVLCCVHIGPELVTTIGTAWQYIRCTNAALGSYGHAWFNLRKPGGAGSTMQDGPLHAKAYGSTKAAAGCILEAWY